MRVLVFGASSAQGYWDSEGGWVDRLKRHYDDLQMQNFAIELPRIMNLGISGDKTADILKRIEPEVEARQNAKGIAIIVQVGSNNAAEEKGAPRSSVEEYKKELTRIIQKASKFTNKIIIVGFPAVDETRTNPVAWAPIYFKNKNIVEFEEAAAEVAGETGASFVGVHQQFIDRKQEGVDLHAHDGLHPNSKGHKLIAQLVRPVLDTILK